MKIEKYGELLAYLIKNDFVILSNEYDVCYNRNFTKMDLGIMEDKYESCKDIILSEVEFRKNFICKVSKIEFSDKEYTIFVKNTTLDKSKHDDLFIQAIGGYFDSVQEGIVVFNDNKVVYRNPFMAKLLNLTGDEIDTLSHGTFLDNHSLKNINKLIESKDQGEITLNITTKDGTRRNIKGVINSFDFGQDKYSIAIVNDYSNPILEEESISEINYLNHTLKAIDQGIIILNQENKITLMNQTAISMTGVSENESIGLHITKVLTVIQEDRPLKYLSIDTNKKEDVLLLSKDGMFWHVNFGLSKIIGKNDENLGKVITLFDTSESRKREKEILYLSYHDVLTGLYNRTYLEETLRRLDSKRQLPFSIIMGDVNGLKITNDVFGHDFGDNLLRRVAKVLKQACRTEDIIGRWGGDEFVILLPQTSSDESFMVLKRIIRYFDELTVVDSVQGLIPSVSLGYGTKIHDYEDVFDVLKIAETNMYKRKMLTKNSMYSSILNSMRTALYEKSHETEEHTSRLYNTAKKVAFRYNVSSEELSDLELLCTLHDVGKIGVSDTILNYPGPLDEAQWEEMKKHSEIGYRIAMATPELKKVANYILYHQEKWDGSGYPKGLKGYAIPLLDRILSVADAFDAMISNRVYRKAMSKEEAFKELELCSGTQFDPDVVQIFINENK